MRTRTLLPALLATALATGGLALASATTADAATVIDVSTAAQLNSALTAASPGDTIRLADGTYTGNFKATVPGTAAARITLMADTATGVVIDSVTVHDLGMEGVHFRNSSKDGVIKNSRIYGTGHDGRGMGEGVYVGTAGNLSDRSDRVQILNNITVTP